MIRESREREGCSRKEGKVTEREREGCSKKEGEESQREREGGGGMQDESGEGRGLCLQGFNCFSLNFDSLMALQLSLYTFLL